jgi:HlyD family secretion protein
MDRIPSHLTTGSAMDSVVPKKRGRLALRIGAGAAAVAAFAAAIWYFMPSGLAVDMKDVRIASVEKGTFLDEIVVRANAEPLHSVVLDSVESGRVDEVLARDGQLVEKGQMLFRLSNPQRHLELLARQAEHAQQISNLSNLRVAQEASNTEHQRRLADLEYALEQAEKQHARNVRLSAQGFISAVALEESSDRLAQQRRQLEQHRRSADLELKVKHTAVAQMETAIDGLNSGLRLVEATVDALAVRAPIAGKLTGFRLQVGETVRPDQRIGRIDDPTRFKLVAQVDEFYLNRLAVGHKGRVTHGGATFPVSVSSIFPQITEGRFTIELVFAKGQPEVLSPGQSMDVQLTLGQPASALILPNGAFVNDSGGAWVFALGHNGRAERQPVRIGRRSSSQVEILSGLSAGDKVIVSSYAGFGKAERLQLSN